MRKSADTCVSVDLSASVSVSTTVSSNGGVITSRRYICHRIFKRSRRCAMIFDITESESGIEDCEFCDLDRDLVRFAACLRLEPSV